MKKTPVRVYTLVFGEEFRFMWAALNRSILANYPKCDFFTGFVHEPRYEKWLPTHCSQNCYKLGYWNEFISGCTDGTRLVFTDADMLVLRPLDAAFDEAGGEWDVAYTQRDAKVPFNSGVLYVHVNERSKAFFNAWYTQNLELYNMGGKALPIVQEYAGLNQRAFAVCQHRVCVGKLDCRLHALPCAIWNCEQSNYANFSDQTAMLHVKSELREYLINDFPQSMVPPEAMALVELCRSYGY